MKTITAPLQDLRIYPSYCIPIKSGYSKKGIEKGIELGIANDLVTGAKNSKHKEGHFGIMTKLHLTRTRGYIDAVISALARFLNPQFYV